MKNPFTPNFGQVPRNIAGRTEIIDQLDYALENAPGDPAITTILIGARGTGKTALLTYISNESEQMGWISVSVSCIKGMLEDVYIQAARKMVHLADSISPKKKITGVSVGIGAFKVDFESGDANMHRNWRSLMSDLLDTLSEYETGLLITIDEVNISLDEMIEFASVYQMFIREERKIALLMAGLPHNVSLLLKNKSVSFLRRANQQYLKNLPDYEVRESLRKTIEYGKKIITESALDEAVKSIDGFPFMLQLVGYRAFILSKEKDVIDLTEIKTGIQMAKEDLKLRILKSTLDEISDMGIDFLRAMLEDEKSSLPSDIGKRLDKNSSYISTYKSRLMEHGVIMPADRNRIRFALPYLREYLRDEYL